MYGIVYTLSDPRTDELRYVGKTVDAPEVRLREHLWPCSLRKNDHRTAWIKSLKGMELKPRIEVLEKCDSKESMAEAEKFWIEQFRGIGFRLVNTLYGGDGWTPGLKRGPITDAHREKLSRAKLGKKKSPEHAAKIAANNRARNLANKGKRLSTEHRRHVSEAVTKWWENRKIQEVQEER